MSLVIDFLYFLTALELIVISINVTILSLAYHFMGAIDNHYGVCVCVCVCVCVSKCESVCVRECVRVCVRVGWVGGVVCVKWVGGCGRVCVCVCVCGLHVPLSPTCLPLMEAISG